MWRCLPALVFVAFLLYYDATRALTKPFRLGDLLRTAREILA